MTESTDVTTAAATTRRDLIRAASLLGAAATLGLAAPRLLGGPAARAQDDADPTATREAELEELDDLRTQVADLETQVARPVECTPAPTETPVPATATATVAPAVTAGTALPYGDTFEVTVLGIANVPSGGDYVPQGRLLQVNLTILNTSAETAAPPFTDWQVTDASGQTFRASPEASNAVLGRRWLSSLQPGELADRAVVFDVLPDAGDTFVLESRDEPSFRVALAIESRG